MNTMSRRALSALAAGLLIWMATCVQAPTALAHPLGNFTVNHYTGITLRSDRIDVHVVVDRAEIAAAQERPRIDRNDDGRLEATEVREYAGAQCARLAEELEVSVQGRPAARWKDLRSGLTHLPGEAGLRTSRLSCTLTTAADLDSPARVAVRTGYDTRRIGWHEITARGAGVTLTKSDVPSRSATDELRRYPQDPLARPLDQRSASLQVAPAGGGEAASAVRAVLPDSGPVGTALGKVTGVFDSLVGRHELTVPVGLLALLLAVVLGASHAAMPGHGKTLMAAYLAGRRGTPRDAVTVGVTVTLTHTAGVLVLGLVLPLATGLAGEAVLTWLGVASGLLVSVIGIWLLRSALQGRTAGHHHHHGRGGHHHGPDGHHHHHGPGGHHHGHGREPHTHDGHTHDDHTHDDHTHDGDHSHRHHDESGHHGDHLHQDDHGPHVHQDGHEHGTHVHEHGTSPLPAQSPTPSPRGPGHPASTDTLVLTERPTALPDTAPTGKATGRSRTGLIGMGVAGGLVPSPSALVVLLGAVALGRTAFGVLLVFAYGLGMAATLTLAGLLLVRLRDRLDVGARLSSARWASMRKLARLGPVLTSCLVLLVGAGLTVRALAGPW